MRHIGEARASGVGGADQHEDDGADGPVVVRARGLQLDFEAVVGLLHAGWRGQLGRAMRQQDAAGP